MKVSEISNILDLAYEARENNMVFNPMFEGEAGLGKSQAVQQWVKHQKSKHGDFGFIDLRLALFEAPDFIGFPYQYDDENGQKRMGHALPHFWPTEGRGLLFLEEPNRANSAITNCIMQLMTDRAVGPKYKLPDGWIIAAATNPDNANYDVNGFDSALKDRFETFKIDYDHASFVEYIERSEWEDIIVQYIKGGSWIYKTPDQISNNGKYISPRTWSKLNTAEKSGAAKNMNIHLNVCKSILGDYEGMQYWQTYWHDRPVMANDFFENSDRAFYDLAVYAKAGKNYSGDKVSMTVESIVTAYDGFFDGKLDKNGDKCKESKHHIDEQTMVEIAKILPTDQAVNLIKRCVGKVALETMDQDAYKSFVERNPEMKSFFKNSLTINSKEKTA